MQGIKPWQLRLRKVSISRFKQRLLVEDGSHEIQDDQVVDPAPPKIQPVLLEFWPPKQPRNPNEAHKDGETPLLHAAEQGRVQLTALSLEARATDEPKFAQGWTPSFNTVRNRHLNTPRFPIENGAAKDQGANDVAAPLLLVATPLLLAAGNGHLDIVHFLVAVGAAIVIKLTRLVQLPFLCSSQYRTFFATFMTELHLLRC